MKKALLVVPALLLALAACDGKATSDASPLPKDKDHAEANWNAMSKKDQASVCVWAHTLDDYDTKRMEKAMEKVGYSGSEAAAMMPIALAMCL